MQPQSIELQQLLSSEQLDEAWLWLLNLIQSRPNAPGINCIFHSTFWGDNPQIPDYEDNLLRISTMLGRLYLASQFGDHRSLISLAHGNGSPSINWVPGPLDRDIRTVITTDHRFRNHLSEHLSFWIRLAVEKKQRGVDYRQDQIEFSCSKPNIQAEDKGPDGLYVEIAPLYKIEVQSVKNSIGNPRRAVASPQFRRSGIACPKHLLDDYWLLINRTDGLKRLEELLERTLVPLQPSNDQQLRLGLIKLSSYNAVVVSNSRHARESLFDGYEHISYDITKRIATYLGAENWRALALRTNAVVVGILRDRGLLT